MEIRRYQESDWIKVWPIIEKVFRTGVQYVCGENKGFRLLEIYQKHLKVRAQITAMRPNCSW